MGSDLAEGIDWYARAAGDTEFLHGEGPEIRRSPTTDARSLSVIIREIRGQNSLRLRLANNQPSS